MVCNHQWCSQSLLLHGLSLSSGMFKTAKEFLTPNHPKIARFYLLPKIPKPSCPGRPIVSFRAVGTAQASLAMARALFAIHHSVHAQFQML